MTSKRIEAQLISNPSFKAATTMPPNFRVTLFGFSGWIMGRRKYRILLIPSSMHWSDDPPLLQVKLACKVGIQFVLSLHQHLQAATWNSKGPADGTFIPGRRFASPGLA